MSVFDSLDTPVDLQSWTPPEFPLIASKGIKEIEADCETSGLDWWNRDIFGGLGYCLPDGTTGYLPVRHRGGNNVDEATFKRWGERELRDVHITNLNTRFDNHTLYRFGIDLEAQGCTLSDVGHFAGLLDDQRQRFSLESIVNDYLKEEQKVLSVFGTRLDPTRMMEHSAAMVAVRAEADCRQVHKLKKILLPLLQEQELMAIKQLEDDVIYPVCEMERNGSRLNMPKLHSWVTEAAAQIKVLRETIAALLGDAHQGALFEGGKPAAFLNPNSGKEMTVLFNRLGLPISRTAPTEKNPHGNPSFTAAVMKSHKGHPVIDSLIKLSKLMDLDARYISGSVKAVSADGIFRYALHQMRAQKDEWGDKGEAGTISGRFSSTEIMTDVGDNIQQRIKVAKQRVSFGYDEDDASHDDELFIIRSLHIPDEGMYHLSSDAKQVEYRVFAHFANNPKINKAYEDNPNLSFHKYTHALIKPFKGNDVWTYRQQKDLNFAKVYGAGLKKLALMLGFINQEQFEYLNEIKAKKEHPLLREAAKIQALYNRELPEVEPLLKKATHLAMEHCGPYCKSVENGKPFDDLLHRQFKHRGFVKTLLGRRSRFPNNYRAHKAFNAVDQGTSADIMKWKIVELHRRRKETGFKMRFVVHDSFDGDIPDFHHAMIVKRILDEQTFPIKMRLPILWDVSIGDNWADAGRDSASVDEIIKNKREREYERKAA
jgi:DNA polymerase-1